MAFSESLILKTIDKAAAILSDVRKQARGDRVSIDDSQARACLTSHARTVEVWSSAIRLLSLLRDKRLRESFVELSLDVGLVRHGLLKPRQPSDGTLTIGDIARGPQHVVILGRPGAGKTTSLQRMGQLALGDWETGAGGVPILVRLRDLRGDETLVTHLLAELGLDIKVPTRMTVPMRRAWERRALWNYLASVSAVLLVDGLDEAHFGIRQEVESELRDLVLFPGDHRLFVTCRTAEFTAPLPNTQAYTILPLSESQVRQFAARWLGESAEAFIDALAQNPYAGSEVVPLTLAHLCAIYERDGELPPRPIDVYELVVSLLVEEWDKQRRVVRTSRYVDFSWRKKERFLQAVAYHLSMRQRKGAFWEEDLRRVYDDIAPEFGLPPDESHEVAKEVESHTGLIQEVGYRRYEFVHLVIQEYLTAMYAHRKANAVKQLMRHYPNELALVIAYSTSPEEYLEQALEEILEHSPDGSPVFLAPFIARLAIEKPLWRPSPRLGWTILAFLDQLARHFRQLNEQHKLRLPMEVLSVLDEPAIVESVQYAAAEAERFEDAVAYRLIPRPHASLPPRLKEFLSGRGAGGLSLLRADRQVQRLLHGKRKPLIARSSGHRR